MDNIFLARPDRPAEGVRLAVKDLFDTAGLVTTYGSILFVDHVPEWSAEAVARAEAAGYANVGKTNLHEFAYGVTSDNPHFGPVPNPLAPGRIAGGSSGGSAAALAAGLADAALGTDSGGSIRVPAACCGVAGFKPTFGLVPLEGCWPLAPSFDHAGPLAREVAGCTGLLAALVPGFVPTRVELEDVTVGVCWLDGAQPLVRARVAAAAERFPRRVALDFPPVDELDVYAIFMREAALVHEGLFPEQAEAYGDDVRRKLERCRAVRDSEVAAAERRRAGLRERCLEALAPVDLLLCPTTVAVAPPLGGESRWLTRLTLPFNVLGWPALALPCGPAEDGLPASVQLVGRPGSDALVLAAGGALERALSLVRGTRA